MLEKAALRVLALTFASLAAPALSATLPAYSATQLSAQLKVAKAGDTIVLAPGEYGTLSTSASFDRPVTLTSADPRRPAHFEALRLNGAKNLRFVALDLGRDSKGEADWARIVDISGGSNLSFETGSIHGSRDGDPSNDITGVKALNVTNLRFSGILFEELAVGMVVVSAAGLIVEGSEFRLIRSDAIDLPGSSQVRISANRFRQFAPAPGDHPDAIQCWTKGMLHGCSDIEISNNLLEGSPGHEMQGIFFGDESQLWKVGRGYRDVTISGNIIISPMFNAICIDRTEGLSLTNNYIAAPRRAAMKPKICISGKAMLSGNISPAYDLDRRLVTPPGNATSPANSDATIAERIAIWTARFRGQSAPRHQ